MPAKLPRRSVRLLPFFTCLCLCLATVSTFGDAQGSKSTYDIRITLYRSTDEAEHARPLPVSIATITVSGTIVSIRDLLVSRYVWADSDAVGLMYALNPDLSDALRPGQKLRVVDIPITPEETTAFSEGFLFKIYYDDSAIRGVVSAQQDLQGLVHAVSTLGQERFSDHSVMQATLDCFHSISSDYGEIVNRLKERSQPTDHEMLSQVGGEVNALRSLLSRITAKNDVVVASDKDTICAVADDLNVKKAGFGNARGSEGTPPRWPVAHVLVRTFDAGTHQPVPMLTIYYAPVALQNDSNYITPFATLSSPAESPPMAEGDYVFWAAKDTSGSPLSERKPVAVRKTGDAQPILVEILVRR